MDAPFLKFTERFCMGCATFTVHYGVKFPVYCSVCKPVDRTVDLYKLEVPSDIEAKEIVLTVDRRSIPLSIKQAETVSSQLAQVIQDKAVRDA